jgi:uncharacterized protein YbcI
MDNLSSGGKSAEQDGSGSGATADLEGGSGLLAEVSRAMVALYKEQFGRGPTKSKTRFADPDTLLCTLEGSLTPAEKSLVALGEDQRLRDVRMFFQHASEAKFRGTIEQLTGRPVTAFISGIDTGKDISVEVFYLGRAPNSDE